MIERNFLKYETDYKTLPFEPIMIGYRRKIVIENLKKYTPKNILEIGCGLEPIFKYYTDYTTMTLVEPSNLFYKRACIFRKSYPNKEINIYNGLFENVSNKLQSKNFDFIIISCLLHELPEPENFIKKVHKLCNSDTIVHINVPNADSFHRILALKSGIINNNFNISETQIKMQQTSVYNLKTLSDKLIFNRFSILDKGSYFIKPFTHAQMQELLDTKIINQQILDGLFAITENLPEWGAEIFVNVKIEN